MFRIYRMVIISVFCFDSIRSRKCFKLIIVNHIFLIFYLALLFALEELAKVFTYFISMSTEFDNITRVFIVEHKNRSTFYANILTLFRPSLFLDFYNKILSVAFTALSAFL